MTASDYLSSAAIVISIGSFCLSAYLAFRDRGHVTASAAYLESYEHMTDAVLVHAVNIGRRPVTVRRLIIESIKGEIFEHKLQNDGKPIRLIESEDIEIALDSENSEITKWAATSISIAYLEDSKGRLYEVEGLPEILRERTAQLQGAV
jgi:hypothetical protein